MPNSDTFPSWDAEKGWTEAAPRNGRRVRFCIMKRPGGRGACASFALGEPSCNNQKRRVSCRRDGGWKNRRDYLQALRKRTGACLFPGRCLPCAVL